VLGLDRAPEVKTFRRKIRSLAEVGKAGDWITAMARRHRHLQLAPSRRRCATSTRVCAYQGIGEIATPLCPE
jgi:hypothetical protein